MKTGAKKRPKDQLSRSALNRAIDSYNEEAQLFKTAEARFKQYKERYTKIIGMYFDKFSLDRYSLKKGEDEAIVVNRIQKSSIKFDADKLEQVLGKDIASQVIQKTYYVEDMEGLIEYLKACGVNGKVFKSFIRVEKSVDQDALDHLESCGAVSMDDIEDCYELVQSKPYFTVKVGKGHAE